MKRILITSLLAGLAISATAQTIVSPTQNAGGGADIGLSVGYSGRDSGYLNLASSTAQVGARANNVESFQVYVVRFELPELVADQTVSASSLLASISVSNLTVPNLSGVTVRAELISSDLTDWATGAASSTALRTFSDAENGFTGGGAWNPGGTFITSGLGIGQPTIANAALLGLLDGYDFSSDQSGATKNYLQVGFFADTELAQDVNNFFSYDSDQDSGNTELSLTFVPEPSSYALLAGLAMVSVMVRRRQ